MSTPELKEIELDRINLTSLQRVLVKVSEIIGSLFSNTTPFPQYKTEFFYRTCGFRGTFMHPQLSGNYVIKDDIINIWNQACYMLCYKYLMGNPGNMINTVIGGGIPKPGDITGKSFLKDTHGREYFTVPYREFLNAIDDTELAPTIAHNITKEWKRKVLGIFILSEVSHFKGENFTDSNGWMFNGINENGEIVFVFNSRYELTYTG